MQNLKRLLVISLALACTFYSFKIYYKYLYRPDISLYGHVKMADGIGRQTVELIQTLKDDFSIRFKTLDKEKNYQDVAPDIIKILEKKQYKNGKVIIFEGVFIEPTSQYLYEKFKDAHTCIKIAYSMFESTEIPEFFVYNLNTFFDAVCVPDSFLVKVYQDSGVNIPIFVLPLGLDLSSFLQNDIKRLPSSPLVFANFSSFIERKNQRLLIESFHEAFGNDPSVKLWLNGRYSYGKCYENLLDYIKALGATNISVNLESLNNKDYLENFKKVDCYVNISQSEGFSIQPREAMALGIPVILSDNTAQKTINQSGIPLSIPSLKLVPAYYEVFSNTYGFRYDVEKKDVITALKAMRANYDLYLDKKQNARDFAKKYDFTNLKMLYRTLVKPKKVILSDKNLIDEGTIYTSSESLYKKYLKL